MLVSICADLIAAAPEPDSVATFYKRVWSLTQSGDKAENPIQGPGGITIVDSASFQVTWTVRGSSEIAYLRYVLMRDVVSIDVPGQDELPAVVYYNGPNGIEWARIQVGKPGSQEASRFDKLIANWASTELPKRR